MSEEQNKNLENVAEQANAAAEQKENLPETKNSDEGNNE